MSPLKAELSRKLSQTPMSRASQHKSKLMLQSTLEVVREELSPKTRNTLSYSQLDAQLQRDPT